VAWRTAELNNIYMQLYDQNGVALGGNILVGEDNREDSYQDNFHKKVQLCYAPDNTLLAVWSDVIQDDDRNEDDLLLWGRRFNEDGSAREERFRIATIEKDGPPPDQRQFYFDVIIDENNNVTVLWREDGDLYFHQFHINHIVNAGVTRLFTIGQETSSYSLGVV